MNFKLNLKGLVAVSMATAFVAGMSIPAKADNNMDLVNALVSKGILTEEEGALLMKGRENEIEVQKKKEKKAWTSHVNMRGYVQNRFTSMLGNDGQDVRNPVDLWADRSVGTDASMNADKNFLIRRARVIIFGDWGDRLSYYIQPDFNNSGPSSGQVGYVQLRDAYGDVYITKDKVHRLRAGLSKVPYGFENLQSSSNRLPMDRVDAFNSAVRDERDTGLFYYYTPENIQALFKEIGDKGLKHSGNYGMFGAGFYNGQGANRADVNDNWHFVARATYPWKTDSGQIFEAGIQGYTGDYQPTTAAFRGSPLGASTRAVTAPNVLTSNGTATTKGIKDERIGVSFMMYPQPFGLQAEWNWGTTPGLEYVEGTTTASIKEKHLQGGYVQAMYKIDNFKFFDTDGTVIPFVRWQYFDGYNKAETNAPKNNVNDWEFGVEWQIAPEVELMAEYHHMKRNNLVSAPSGRTNAQDYQSFTADALRVQLQYNF